MRLLFKLSINKLDLILASIKIKLNHSNLPANKRIFAHFVLPWRAAFISGVKPKVFLASTSISGHLCRRMLRHSVCPVRKTRNKEHVHHRRFARTRAIFHNSRYFGTKRFSARVIAMCCYVARKCFNVFAIFGTCDAMESSRIPARKASPAKLMLDRVPAISWRRLSSLCVIYYSIT